MPKYKGPRLVRQIVSEREMEFYGCATALQCSCSRQKNPDRSLPYSCYIRPGPAESEAVKVAG